MARGDTGTSIFCRPCADAHSARSAARKTRLRAEWSKAAACNGCGAVLSDTSFKLCDACRAYARRAYATVAKPRKVAKRGSGVCVGCAEPSTHGSNYCRKHWLEGCLRAYGFTADQYDAMWARLEAQEFRCYYTGVPLIPGVNCSLDHRVPRSRGGSPTDVDNCVWCDRLINAFKNDLTEDEFVERCRTVMNRFG